MNGKIYQFTGLQIYNIKSDITKHLVGHTFPL